MNPARDTEADAFYDQDTIDASVHSILQSPAVPPVFTDGIIIK